jgi:hypothetical protein
VSASARVTQQKANFLAALKALVPNDPGTGKPVFEVLPSSSVKAAFNRLSRRKSFFIVYGGRVPAGPQPAGAGFTKTRIVDSWFVAIVAESYRSLEEAYAQANGCDDMLELIDAVRGADISDSAHPNQVKVRCDDITLEEGETTIEGGGTVGYVALFHSNEYVI